MKKKFLIPALYTLNFFSHLQATYNLETYIESWDYNNGPPATNALTAVQGIPIQSYPNFIFDIAFAWFQNGTNVFSSTNTGLQWTITSDQASVITEIHANEGKVKLSFGGANPQYYFSQLNSSNTNTFISNLVNFVSTNDLDGVDFDLEGSPQSGTTQIAYAQQIESFLYNLRNALDNKIISVTIPGQGWNAYWQYLIQAVNSYEKANNTIIVDYWNFMEYDIWVNPGLTFTEQILADLQTYTGSTNTNPGPNAAPGWGIPGSKIQLGLMIGQDDLENFISVEDAVGLVSSAVEKFGLYGIMTWDLDRDALNPDASTPINPLPTTKYSYTTSLYQALQQASEAKANNTNLPRRIKIDSRKPHRLRQQLPGYFYPGKQREESPPNLDAIPTDPTDPTDPLTPPNPQAAA